MLLLESFKWLHWWHGHDEEARRVADRSVGILLREGKREINRFGMQIEEKIIPFPSVEHTCAALV